MVGILKDFWRLFRTKKWQATGACTTTPTWNRIPRQYRLEEITYELFGIDPGKFYETKFANGADPDMLSNPFHHYSVEYEKIRRLVADLQALLPNGGTALDIGCGSGTYGRTLVANVPGLILHNVDMSKKCLKQASMNGYAATRLFNLEEPLPYDDGTYDVVFSMDLFGHIEFRHKDALIGEIARVTKPGGGGHHGVESGYVDYLNCNPKDPNNPVRRYVYIDGHIGVEPASDICQRFSRRFAEVRHHVTYLYPFVVQSAFGELFGDEFQKLLSQYNQPKAIEVFSLVIGRLNRYFVDLYERVFGAAFQPSYSSLPDSRTPEHERAYDLLRRQIDDHNSRFGPDFVPLPKELFRPAGFSSLTLKKGTGR
ncbi:MAG: methyltransferase domain-containing protein [Thermoguttaceae bacterium]|jgi:ubiquinone/menaquinone biosynthesis C-methylase UbiE